jgi:hypothetical protein
MYAAPPLSTSGRVGSVVYFGYKTIVTKKIFSTDELQRFELFVCKLLNDKAW